MRLYAAPRATRQRGRTEFRVLSLNTCPRNFTRFYTSYFNPRRSRESRPFHGLKATLSSYIKRRPLSARQLPPDHASRSSIVGFDHLYRSPSYELRHRTVTPHRGNDVLSPPFCKVYISFFLLRITSRLVRSSAENRKDFVPTVSDRGRSPT